MAVKHKIAIKGSKLTLNPDLEEKIKESYTLPPTVEVVCLIDAIVKVTGTVTGNLYTFSGGTPEDVDERDVDELLNKKRGNACCGGTSGASIFELHKEII